MLRRSSLFALPVAAALLLGACGDDQDPALTPGDDTTTTTAASGYEAEGEVELSADLSGDAEVPGPGDDDGSGAAEVTIDLASAEICFEVSVDNIDPPTAAHIHEGTPDEAGPIVVELGDPSDDGVWDGCTVADADLAADIAANPAGYYVNVHNEPFPAGAVRGQLPGS
ncbi:MAG TPA: CHRD domain-containing protein [Acidimicrobiales bacterium]|nr:CHRD domain-containing protein [Acidimicrobiales bacterium]